MIKKNTLTLILVLFFSGGSIFSQTKKADSLRSVIKTLKDDSTKVKAIVKLGNELFAYADFDELNTCFIEAKELGEKINYKKGYANACNNLGILYLNQGLYDQALNFHLNALKARQEITDKSGIMSSYQNLGIVCIALHNYDKALEYYNLSLRLKEEMGDKAGIAGALQGIGFTYQKMKDYKKAMEYYSKCLKIREELKDTSWIANMQQNLGSVYFDQENYPEALKYYLNGLHIKEKLKEADMRSAYSSLAKVYSKLKNYKEALKYSDLNIVIIQKKGNSLDGLKNYEKTLSEIYEGMGDKNNALIHYKKFIQYRDSMFNEDNTKKAVASEMNFEFKKKEEIVKAENDKALAISAEEKRRKNIVILSISIGLVLVFILVIVILRSLLQNKQKNKIITQQKELVEEKNREVLDSINYAQRIQQGILPDESELKNIFSDSFVLFKPKDIVSGDFYWFLRINEPNKNKNIAAVVAADCTGHGVPGAFMSMLNSTLLNQTAYNPNINTPADALNFLNKELPKNLKSFDKNSTIKDGMDLAFCLIDFNKNSLQYAGANNPCIILRNKEIIELKPLKQAITATEEFDKKPFTNQTFDIQKDDIIYLFTDGFADQFGGPKGKKFKYKQLNELLVSINDLNLSKQKEKLESTFMNWKNNLEQVDDVLIIGIKI